MFGYWANMTKDLLVAFAVGRYTYVFAMANGWDAPDCIGVLAAGFCLMWVDFVPPEIEEKDE